MLHIWLSSTILPDRIIAASADAHHKFNGGDRGPPVKRVKWNADGEKRRVRKGPGRDRASEQILCGLQLRQGSRSRLRARALPPCQNTEDQDGEGGED